MIALDLVFTQPKSTTPKLIFTGGSCGNVLSILSFLGWKSIPFARLKNDTFGRHVVEDLKKWCESLDLLRLDEKGITPVMVQRNLGEGNARKDHRFEWKCPKSGSWLPRYRPMPIGLVKEFIDDLPDSDVFYFDRAEKATLLLASEYSQKGAVVFFEPSSLKEDEVTQRCLEVADIVKYSGDRIAKIPFKKLRKYPFLEIQTLGKEGLRYRLKRPNVSNRWVKLGAPAVNDFVDSAGAGDWCSAGVISALEIRGRSDLLEKSEKEIACAIEFGQALGSLNCRFTGARGGMYGSGINRFIAEFKSLQNSIS